MNIKTVALTKEQYQTIIQTMKQGFTGCRPNERIATVLTLEANLGLRISDIIHLRLADIVKDGDRYRLSIVEQKTKRHETSLSRWLCISTSAAIVLTTVFHPKQSSSHCLKEPYRSN